MNSLKTMFLAVLMSAATYGVYVTITGSPPGPLPKDAPKEWSEDPPLVEEPVGDSAPASAAKEPTAAPLEERPLATEPPAGASQAGTGSNDVGPAEPPHPAERPSAYPVAGASQNASTAAPDGVGLAARGGRPSDSLAGSGRYPEGSPDDRYPDTARVPVGDDRRARRDAAAERYPMPNAIPPDDRYPPDGYPTAGEPRREGGAAFDEANPPDATPAQIHDEFVARMQVAQAHLAAGRLVEALLELSQEVGIDLSPQDEAPLMELLDQLAGTVVYSREHLLERPYEVQPGDTLDRIAGEYQVPWQLLANINGISDPRRQLRPGDTLKVIKGPFEAVIDLRRFRLTLFVRDCYAGRFAIGIGKDLTTPEGKFEVRKKVVNPIYYGEQTIEGGSPDNPMGEYALEFADHMYIHGTNDPASIGRAESKGCIRLSERDIADVFQILSEKTDRSPGSLVYIQR